MKKDFLVQYEAYEQTDEYGRRRGKKEKSDVFGNLSGKVGVGMLEDDEGEEEFEIVPAAIDETFQSRAVHESRKDHPTDVSEDQVVDLVERRPLLVLEIRVSRGNRDSEKQDFFYVIDAGYSDLEGKEYRGEYAER